MMNSRFFEQMIPDIEPETVVHFQYGKEGLVKLDGPKKASDLTCYSCGGMKGYFNLPWKAWCCRDENCWGPMPVEKEEKKNIKELKVTISLKEIGVPEKYCNCCLSNCYQSNHKIDHFKEWVRGPKGFMVFSGLAGSGKTYAAYSILNEYLKSHGNDARFFNVADLYFEYRSEVTERGVAMNLLDKFTNCRFLLMDDLGQRTPTDAYLEFIYVIVNKRYEKNLPTIITTNLNGELMEKKLGEAITSRVLSGQTHYFDGKDRRLKVNNSNKIENIY